MFSPHRPCRAKSQSEPVYEGDDDVLDIDVLMELSAGAQERVQSLEVELIREHLQNGGNRKKTLSSKSKVENSAMCIDVKSYKCNNCAAL